MPKSPQPSRDKPRKAGSSQASSNRSSAGRKYNQRQAAKQQAALRARQARNRTIGLASIVLVVVIVAAFLLASQLGGGGSAAGSSPPAGTPVPASTMDRLASIPLSTLVDAPSSGVVTPIQTIKDPALTADGKPDLLFIGAEFCPICATERWAMYVALSKFGTFTPQPGQIHSAVQDGDIQTLTFYKTTYSSPYFTFTPVEMSTNEPTTSASNTNGYVTLQKPTAAQEKIWLAHTDGSWPFLDFGGKAELTAAQYSPDVLEGVSFDNIAKDIGNNSTVIGADVDASAKVLIKTICTTLTDGKPAAVCSAVGDG